MSDIVVAGLINIETTLKVKGFPIEYFPIDYPFYGVKSEVAGVGVNIPKAFTTLGEQVKVISLVGQDEEGKRVERYFKKEKWKTKYVKSELSDTPQSVILYDSTGRRQIYCDLKDIQDKSYDCKKLNGIFDNCKVAVLCNSNFVRPLVNEAKQKGILIATDVHVLSDINDAYNKEFMEQADILFLSDEKLPCEPKEFLCQLMNTYSNKVIVMGQGDKGAMIYVKGENKVVQIGAVHTRDVVNTVGAGDALFSAFVHYYIKGKTPIEALKRAQIFASYKIGEDGAAKGFIEEHKVEELYQSMEFQVEEMNL